MTDSIVQDAGDLRKYRIELPNLLDDLGLSVYAFRLYVHLKRVAGASPIGACYQGTRTIAKVCKMSKDKVTQSKLELAEAGLITITKRTTELGDNDTDLITIADLWPRNFEHFGGVRTADRVSAPTPTGVRTADRVSAQRTKEVTVQEVTEKRIERAAPQAATARPLFGNVESGKPSKPSDPNLSHPAVMLVRSRCKITPADWLRERIAAEVTDLNLWQTVIENWVARGYKPTNLAGMLDWYKTPALMAQGPQKGAQQAQAPEGALPLTSRDKGRITEAITKARSLGDTDAVRALEIAKSKGFIAPELAAQYLAQ